MAWDEELWDDTQCLHARSSPAEQMQGTVGFWCNFRLSELGCFEFSSSKLRILALFSSCKEWIVALNLGGFW